MAQFEKPIKARITYYTKHEDKYGSRVAMSQKMRAKQGETVAAHPLFPFGTKVIIPELKGKLDKDALFIVEDRGRDVRRMRASRGRAFVFDIYLDKTNRAMKRFASHQPAYMDVYVKK